MQKTEHYLSLPVREECHFSSFQLSIVAVCGNHVAIQSASGASGVETGSDTPPISNLHITMQTIRMRKINRGFLLCLVMDAEGSINKGGERTRPNTESESRRPL